MSIAMTETGWARIGIRIELSAESDDIFLPRLGRKLEEPRTSPRTT
jgi:hypothetical protein